MLLRLVYKIENKWSTQIRKIHKFRKTYYMLSYTKNFLPASMAHLTKIFGHRLFTIVSCAASRSFSEGGHRLITFGKQKSGLFNQRVNQFRDEA